MTHETSTTTENVHKLTTGQRMIVTITFFSMFFGASNLIFPPLLGAEAGRATLPAMLGFICSAVGLPILGVLAVTRAGGFKQLASRVSPKFALVLGTAIILTIGPLFAIPRTAATSFEMAVAPLTPTLPGWATQLGYSVVFFGLSCILSQHPERLADTIGRFMAPLLLAMIAVLVVVCLFVPHGPFTTPLPTYAHGQVIRGFIEGYQTMDLLAALYFGIVIAANVRGFGVTQERQNRRELAWSGAGTGVMMAVIYAALAYVGGVSGSMHAVNPAQDTGATVLTNLTSSVFGRFGTAFVGLIFVLACFNVCTGLIATCASYFKEQFPKVFGHPMSYRTWSMLFVVFSLVIANAGLSTIIRVSVPVLSALYPLAIVLVVFGLLHTLIGRYAPRVYFWTVLLVGIFTCAQCVVNLLAVLGVSWTGAQALFALLPLASEQLTWLLPAALGLFIGVIDSLIRGDARPAAAHRE